MKADIHPQFYDDARVVCQSCGYSFITGSTKKLIQVEVCYRCHPLYTGEQRYIDTKGKVDRFEKKRQQAKDYQLTKTSKKHKKEQKSERKIKTLKELLTEI